MMVADTSAIMAILTGEPERFKPQSSVPDSYTHHRAGGFQCETLQL